MKKNTSNETIPEIVFNIRKPQLTVTDSVEYITHSNSLENLFDEDSSIYKKIESQKLEDITTSKSLNLNNKGLKTFPIINNPHNLEELNLSNNRLSNLPEDIQLFISLIALNLSNNQIETIPDSFRYLTSLKVLNLNRNRLTTISDWVLTLEHLQAIYLSDNQLSELSGIIGSLKGLTEMNVSNNSLTELPKNIGDLQDLTYLNIEKNKLKKIPESFSELQNLTILNLSDNYLQEFPSGITHLHNLTHLYLNSNQIDELPESISHLKHLEILSLENNQLISLPESIGELTSLTTLILENNQFMSLPESIGNLNNLTTLILKNNQLKQLPDTIAKLKNLTKLNLINNDLKTIPESLGILPDSTLILIKENPYSLPPKDLLEGLPGNRNNIWPVKAIRNYYKHNKTDTDFLFEANLLIISEENTEKQSIVSLLTQSENTSQEYSTNVWTFEMDNERIFKVNIITSGHHGVHYSRLRFLLSKYSLCILLTDDERKATDVNYWLNTLDISIFETPFLIVVNQKNDHFQDIPEKSLFTQFSNVKDVLSINCNTQNGISQLKQHIQKHLLNLPHIATALNHSWNNVRQQLKNETSHIIPYGKLVGVYIINGIEANKQNQVSECLHAIGDCLHFQNDSLLNSFVFLSIDWCSQAAYNLFTNQQVINNFGLFTLSDLDKIWGEEKFEHHRTILHLMKKLKLCYEISEIKGTFIVPHLLNPFRPEFSQWNDNNNDIFFYQYNYMPPGMITKMITEMFPFIYKKEFLWQYGMILENNKTLAEILINVTQKELRLRISGKHKKEFIAVLQSKLNGIHKTYDKLSCIENHYTNDTMKMSVINRSLISAPITKYNLSQRKEIARINSDNDDYSEVYPQIKNLLTQAQNYENNNEFEKAIKQFKKIIDINEFFIPAWQGLDNNYKNMGDSSKTEISTTLRNLVEIFDFEKNVNTNMRLNSIELENLSFFDNFKWSFAQMNVLLGRNGYGKTHLLRFIVSLLQKDRLSAEYFKRCKPAAFSEINLEKDSIPGNLIYRTKSDFEKTVGNVPLLAIPDLRYIDKSADIKLQSAKLDYFRDLGGYHFLHQQSYSPVIENFLLDLCTIYLDKGKTFDSQLFIMLNKVMQELTEDEFAFDSIEYGVDSTFTFKVITEGNNTPVPIQMISQGTFSLLSIFGIIYKHLQSVYPDVSEAQLLEKRAIVFIDELDAHLHPVWHQRIIRLLRNNFPNVQFFVSAHSPLIVAGCLRDEVSVLRKSENNSFSLFQFEKDFIGYDPLSIYREIFEIENRDESYRYYSACYPFRNNKIERIESLNKKENLTYQETDELNRLKDELYYIERTREKETKHMNYEQQLQEENEQLRKQLREITNKQKETNE